MKRVRISLDRARAVLAAVSEDTGVSVDDLIGDARHARVATARKEAYRRLLDVGLSYSAVARLMQRHHTTVMAGVGAI